MKDRQYGVTPRSMKENKVKEGLEEFVFKEYEAKYVKEIHMNKRFQTKKLRHD